MMWTQASLTGEKLPLPKTLDEIKNVCCASCFYAEEKECDCQCHGAYHGLGNLAKRNKLTQIKQNKSQFLMEVKQW